MTSQGGKHISTEQEKEEENFYDCQEIIEFPDGSGGENGKQEKGGSLEDLTAHRLTDESMQEEKQVNGLQEEPVNKLQDEDEPVNKLQEQDQGNAPLDDLETELKENTKEVEFDDDYLREVENELTEEEKEVTVTISLLQLSYESIWMNSPEKKAIYKPEQWTDLLLSSLFFRVDASKV